MKNLIAGFILNVGSAVFNLYIASLPSAVMPAVSLFFGIISVICSGFTLKCIHDEWIINERRSKW